MDGRMVQGSHKYLVLGMKNGPRAVGPFEVIWGQKRDLGVIRFSPFFGERDL
jgi:hypothetical protein